MPEEKYRKEFGNYLKTLRLDTAFSQACVSAECGYNNSQFLSNIERGLAWPPMNMMTKLYTC